MLGVRPWNGAVYGLKGDRSGMTTVSGITSTPCGKKISHRPISYEVALTRLRAHLGKSSLKNSRVREQVLAIIAKYPGHFSVNELCLKVAKVYPEIGKATVYRVIGLFIEAGVLKEGPSRVDGLALYELTEEEGNDHHDHIVCLDCGGVFEFHDEAIEALQLETTKKLGFSAQYHRHVIYAQCLKIRHSNPKKSSI